MKALARLLLALMLTACAPRQGEVSCGELVQLRDIVGKQYTATALYSWILDTFHVTGEEVSDYPFPGRADYRILNWQSRAGAYFTLVLDHSVVVDVSSSNIGASAEEVVRCFGQPRLYNAAYKPDISGAQLSFELVFPDSGLLTSGAMFYRFGSIPEQPPKIHPGFPITFFRFVQQRTTEEVLQNVFGELRGSDFEQKTRTYNPWPGDLKDVQVTPFVSPP